MTTPRRIKRNAVPDEGLVRSFPALPYSAEYCVVPKLLPAFGSTLKVSFGETTVDASSTRAQTSRATVLIVNSSGCISDGSTGNDAEAELAVVVEVVRTPELPENVASPLKLAHVDKVPVSASIFPNGVTAPASAVIEEYDCRQAIIAQIGAAAPPLVLIFTSHKAGAEPATVETSGMVAGSVVEANVSSASVPRASGPTGIVMSTIIT